MMSLLLDEPGEGTETREQQDGHLVKCGHGAHYSSDHMGHCAIHWCGVLGASVLSEPPHNPCFGMNFSGPDGLAGS